MNPLNEISQKVAQLQSEVEFLDGSIREIEARVAPLRQKSREMIDRVLGALPVDLEEVLQAQKVELVKVGDEISRTKDRLRQISAAAQPLNVGEGFLSKQRKSWEALEHEVRDLRSDLESAAQFKQTFLLKLKRWEA